MTPHPRFLAICERQFALNEQYTLVLAEEASTASRGHYFASLRDAWLNLPEIMEFTTSSGEIIRKSAKDFPTSEYLRKWLLIEAGYYDEQTIACDSHTEATRVAVFAHTLDSYARIGTSGNLVVVRRAASQSAQAMDKEKFQKSKQDVLDFASSMIGVPRTVLQKQTS